MEYTDSHSYANDNDYDYDWFGSNLLRPPSYLPK